MSENEPANSADDYIDVENASASHKENLFNFRFIVMEQLQRICRLQSIEFTGGFYHSVTRSIDGVPRTERLWIPDTRQAYVNGTIALYNLLHSKIVAHSPKKKTGSINHKEVVCAAYEKVEKDLRERKPNDDTSALVLVLDTHVLLRTIISFLNEKNFLGMTIEDDV